MSVIPVVLAQYVTITQIVCTQYSNILIQKPTDFVCTKEPSSGFTFQTYIKEICVSVAIHTAVNLYIEMSFLHKNICECHFWEAVLPYVQYYKNIIN